MRLFSGEAVLKHIHDDEWELQEELSYGHHTVPVGFRTDLATIPRPLWPLIAPFDIARPAIIHDYLYSQLPQTDFSRPRRYADRTILEAMKSIDTPLWKQYCVYAAVRLFGGLVHRYGI